MKTLHTIVEEGKRDFIKNNQSITSPLREGMWSLWFDTFAASLLSAFEGLVPKEKETTDLAGMGQLDLTHERHKAYNACRAELMDRIAAFKEGI